MTVNINRLLVNILTIKTEGGDKLDCASIDRPNMVVKAKMIGQ